MLLLLACQLRPRTSDADDHAVCPSGSKSHRPFEIHNIRPAVSVPYVSFCTPTYAQRLNIVVPLPTWPTMELRPPSSWKMTLVPPPISSTPLRPNMPVPQSPLSARKRETLRPLPFVSPLIYSRPVSIRPYRVTLLWACAKPPMVNSHVASITFSFASPVAQK